MIQASNRIRQPRFADDRWYSATASNLKKDIQGYLQDTPAQAEELEVIGLVAPHAGHTFSGHVAGAGFGLLTSGAFEQVVLIGPDHRGAASGQIASLEVDAWRTPLGDIPVAWDLLEALQANIELTLLPTDQEHSLEVELPFLQLTLGHFELVPLMMGDQSRQTCRGLGQALVKALSAVEAGPTLLVASSDLSHFFDDATARRLDQATLDFVLRLDADGLVQHVEAGHRQHRPLACGAGPIAAIIHSSKALGANQAHLIKYATSADIHPRKDQVVGYAAVVLSRA